MPQGGCFPTGDMGMMNPMMASQWAAMAAMSDIMRAAQQAHDEEAAAAQSEDTGFDKGVVIQLAKEAEERAEQERLGLAVTTSAAAVEQAQPLEAWGSNAATATAEVVQLDVETHVAEEIPPPPPSSPLPAQVGEAASDKDAAVAAETVSFLERSPPKEEEAEATSKVKTSSRERKASSSSSSDKSKRKSKRSSGNDKKKKKKNRSPSGRRKKKASSRSSSRQGSRSRKRRSRSRSRKRKSRSRNRKKRKSSSRSQSSKPDRVRVLSPPRINEPPDVEEVAESGRRRSKWDVQVAPPAAVPAAPPGPFIPNAPQYAPASSLSLPQWLQADISLPSPSSQIQQKVIKMQALQIRCMLGVRGDTINWITNRSGADIKVKHARGEQWGHVSIVGNVERTLAVIQEVLKQKGCPLTEIIDQADPTPGRRANSSAGAAAAAAAAQDDIECPSELVGLFIGVNGANIKEIKARAGGACSIQVQRNDVPGRPQTIKVAGDNIQYARELVRAKIEDCRRQHEQQQAARRGGLTGGPVPPGPVAGSWR
eukprot:TRINITY_DN25991_c0_g1_i1.p1 TRINITY_DN25991_c0_g1~~TRINITY_DN25991_c0_g1_i1.p1  ORF type:complete len:608 (-),score=135.21 TRINITY_DN25991_c0_g1_i1:234-1850(-)